MHAYHKYITSAMRSKAKGERKSLLCQVYPTVGRLVECLIDWPSSLEDMVLRERVNQIAISAQCSKKLDLGLCKTGIVIKL